MNKLFLTTLRQPFLNYSQVCKNRLVWKQKIKLNLFNFPVRTFCASAEAERSFDYSKMDYYEVLQISPAANQKDLKKAYLKLAKQYHPDIYKGINQDHFKKANEAFTLLKNPLKRKEYNRKMKILRMKHQQDFKDFDQNTAEHGFDSEAYQKMKRKTSKVREEIDPEIEAELKKWNFDKMFMEFNDRPMRSHPDELKVMQPEIIKKMSRRDIARMKFVSKRREMEKINRNIRKRYQEHKIMIENIMEDDGMEYKKYDQLVEEIKKDHKRLEQVDNPMIIYKTDQETITEETKKQDERVHSVRRVLYPILLAAFIINSLIIIGVYHQNKQSARNSKTWEKRESLNLLKRSQNDQSGHVPKNIFK